MHKAHPFFAAPILTTSTSNAEVSYRKFGVGPAVVFIHGWPLSSATYRDVAKELCERYTCYLPDLPGAGESPGYRDWRQPLEQHTSTMVEFTENLGLDRFALIGHDSGGAIARHVAALLGDRISALVLSNTEITGHIAAVVKSYASFTKLPGSMWVLRALFGSERFRKSRYGFGGCFHDRELISGDFFELFLAPMLADFKRFKGTMALLSNVDFDELANLAPVHEKIHAPTRFVWGARDSFFPIGLAREMSSEFLGLEKFVEFPEGKLFVHEEFPERFSKAAAELLDVVVPRVPVLVRGEA